MKEVSRTVPGMAVPGMGNLAGKLADILHKKSIPEDKHGIVFSLRNLPFDIRKIYPNYKHYRLELGCGWGEFTRTWAVENPDSLTIATEKKRGRLLSSAAKHINGHPTNIRYLTLNMEWFFEGVFSQNTFDSVVVNFPDPWPKKRHHKHRYFSADFIQNLAATMRTNAICEFATDSIEYMVYAANNLERSGEFENLEGKGVLLGEIPGRPQSYFETLWREKSLPVYFIRYKKKGKAVLPGNV